MQEITLKLADTLGYGDAGQILVLVCLLFFFAAKGLYSLNIGWSKARQEFLQLWDLERAERDPLWCEVLIRHYCRGFLPARVIINAASNVHAAETLWLLSHSADFYQLDDGLVRWKRRRHGKTIGSAIEIVVGFALYVTFAFASMLILLQCVRNHDAFSGIGLVVASVAGLILGAAAIKSLNHGFDLSGARKSYFKLQELRPSMIPEHMERTGSIARRMLLGAIAKLRGLRNSVEST